MLKKEIFIFARDEPYVKALSSYMARNDTGWNPCLLWHEEEAKNMISLQKIVLSDALMPGRYLFLSETRYQDETGAAEGQEGIMERGDGAKEEQASGAESGEKQKQENPCLYKYLPADILIDEIRYHASELQEITRQTPGAKGTWIRTGAQNSRLILVASGAGGRGNSVITVAVSRCLAEGGAKVLCIGMESIGALQVYSGVAGSEPPRSLSDYIYKVLSGRHVLSENGFTYCDAASVRYFYDEEGICPIVKLSVEEAEKLMAYLVKEEPYDYIVADAADLTSAAAATCLTAYCSKALLVGDATPASKRKNKQLKRLMQSENSSFLRIREVINRWDGQEAEREEHTFLIREEKEAFCHMKDSTEILSHTGFADGIQEVCQWIKEG